MRMKSVQIEEEVHTMLVEKSKEFKKKNSYELPLGIIIGKVCRKYLKDMELIWQKLKYITHEYQIYM